MLVTSDKFLSLGNTNYSRGRTVRRNSRSIFSRGLSLPCRCQSSAFRPPVAEGKLAWKEAGCGENPHLLQRKILEKVVLKGSLTTIFQWCNFVSHCESWDSSEGETTSFSAKSVRGLTLCLWLVDIFWTSLNAHFVASNPLQMGPEQSPCNRQWHNSRNHEHCNSWQGAMCLWCKHASGSWLHLKLSLGCIKRRENEYLFFRYVACQGCLKHSHLFCNTSLSFLSFFGTAAWTKQCFCGALDALVTDSIKRQSFRKYLTFVNCWFSQPASVFIL